MRTRIIMDYVRACSGKILHVGCADPDCEMDSSAWLHAHIHAVVEDRLVGVDLDIPRVREMLKAGYNVVWYDQADVWSFENQFDLVIAGEMIEHVPDQEGMVSELANCLSPGGILLISTPNPFAFTHAVWHWLSGKEHHGNEHVLWQSPKTLANLLMRHKMKINKTYYCFYGFKSRKWRWLFLSLFEMWPYCRQTILYEIRREGT